MKILVDIDINAPIKQVFAAFTDFEALDKRIEGIERIEILRNTKELVGSRWKETRTEMGKTATVEMWVIDAKKNESFVIESLDHGIKYLSRYTFTKSSSGVTNVELGFSGEPLTFAAKLMSALMVLFKGTTKKLFLKDLNDMKRALEKS